MNNLKTFSRSENFLEFFNNISFDKSINLNFVFLEFGEENIGLKVFPKIFLRFFNHFPSQKNMLNLMLLTVFYNLTHNSVCKGY